MGTQHARRLPDHPAFQLSEEDRTLGQRFGLFFCVMVFVVACIFMYRWQLQKVQTAEKRLENLQLQTLEIHRRYDPYMRMPLEGVE